MSSFWRFLSWLKVSESVWNSRPSISMMTRPRRHQVTVEPPDSRVDFEWEVARTERPGHQSVRLGPRERTARAQLLANGDDPMASGRLLTQLSDRAPVDPRSDCRVEQSLERGTIQSGCDIDEANFDRDDRQPFAAHRMYTGSPMQPHPARPADRDARRNGGLDSHGLVLQQSPQPRSRGVTENGSRLPQGDCRTEYDVSRVGRRVHLRQYSIQTRHLAFGHPSGQELHTCSYFPHSSMVAAKHNSRIWLSTACGWPATSRREKW